MIVRHSARVDSNTVPFEFSSSLFNVYLSISESNTCGRCVVAHMVDSIRTNKREKKIRKFQIQIDKHKNLLNFSRSLSSSPPVPLTSRHRNWFACSYIDIFGNVHRATMPVVFKRNCVIPTHPLPTSTAVSTIYNFFVSSSSFTIWSTCKNVWSLTLKFIVDRRLIIDERRRCVCARQYIALGISIRTNER